MTLAFSIPAVGRRARSRQHRFTPPVAVARRPVLTAARTKARRCRGDEAVEGVDGRLTYLPPYSPDLNPIEKAFSKVKPILRKAAARTLEELWAAIRTALTAFTPGECANYFAACGYNPA
jgi:transposase